MYGNIGLLLTAMSDCCRVVATARIVFMDTSEISAWLNDARQRTIDLVADIPDDKLFSPKLDIINPWLWELGHISWFQEKWILRDKLGRKPILNNADALYDSSAVPHDTRWDLPLPDRAGTVKFAREVNDRVLEYLSSSELDDEGMYFILLSLYHEDMHGEAFTYTRQTLEYAPPTYIPAAETPNVGVPASDQTIRDCQFAGGHYLLGASRDQGFVFDNEKWAHTVEVGPFAIADRAVTNGQFAEFVNDKGYERKEFWSEPGWQWLQNEEVKGSLYWRRDSGNDWQVREFDKWVRLKPECALIHVNWHEANAYCRWKGRRLPTEAEWELAASMGTSSVDEQSCTQKRMFPWGSDAPDPARMNMDSATAGTIDAGLLAGGDTPSGCRQMFGNVWEWTESDFLPFPGFELDPYKEYSEPWFGTRKVLKGGCWASRARMLRNSWRNFYEPHRRDVFAGFRTCAINK